MDKTQQTSRKERPMTKPTTAEVPSLFAIEWRNDDYCPEWTFDRVVKTEVGARKALQREADSAESLREFHEGAETEYRVVPMFAGEPLI